jgi:hypothetical protein
MMSTPMQKAADVAAEYDEKLLATDPRFRGLVVVKPHMDGSSFTFSDAFILSWNDWYLVFTEHYGTHVFHKEDNDVCAYTERVGIEEIEVESK